MVVFEWVQHVFLVEIIDSKKSLQKRQLGNIHVNTRLRLVPVIAPNPLPVFPNGDSQYGAEESVNQQDEP